MNIFKKIFSHPKVDKAELIRALVTKRINESYMLRNFGMALGVQDANQMSKLQLLSLPEAGIVTNVETYVAHKNKGVSDLYAPAIGLIRLSQYHLTSKHHGIF
jgi:hypothetical protein